MIYRRKVNFYETDAQGVVHHSNYLRYFEEARGYFLEQKGSPYGKIREELDIDVVLTEVSISYKKPLKFGDEFIIDFDIKSKDRFFFTFEYKIFSKDQLIATGKTRHVCINRKTGKIVSLPEIFKR